MGASSNWQADWLLPAMVIIGFIAFVWVLWSVSSKELREEDAFLSRVEEWVREAGRMNPAFSTKTVTSSITLKSAPEKISVTFSPPASGWYSLTIGVNDSTNETQKESS